MIGAAGDGVGEIEAAVLGPEGALGIHEDLAHQLGLYAGRNDARYAGRSLRQSRQRHHSAQNQRKTPALAFLSSGLHFSPHGFSDPKIIVRWRTARLPASVAYWPNRLARLSRRAQWRRFRFRPG